MGLAAPAPGEEECGGSGAGAEPVQSARGAAPAGLCLTRRGLQLVPRPRGVCWKRGGRRGFGENNCPPSARSPSARPAAIFPSARAAEADCCSPPAGAGSSVGACCDIKQCDTFAHDVTPVRKYPCLSAEIFAQLQPAAAESGAAAAVVPAALHSHIVVCCSWFCSSRARPPQEREAGGRAPNPARFGFCQS